VLQNFLASTDHFSPLLAGLFFWDSPASLAPIDWLGRFWPGHKWDMLDRATIFERSFKSAWPSDTFNRDFVEVAEMSGSWPSRNKFAVDNRPAAETGLLRPKPAPVILLNTVRSNDGGLDVVSNVRFGPEGKLCTAQEPGEADEEGGSSSVRNLLECMTADPELRGKTLTLATAAHITARFPLVSPPGLLILQNPKPLGAVRTRGEWYDVIQQGEDGDGAWKQFGKRFSRVRYVDGGYLDNSGALSASEAVAALQRAAKCPNADCAGVLDIVVLHIYARSLGDPRASSIKDSESTLPELSAPLGAVTGARAVQGRTPVENLCRLIMPRSEDSKCRQLVEFREAERAPAKASSEEAARCEKPFAPGYDEGIVLGARKVGLPWINAALDVEDKDMTAKDYVPLGWLLGGSRSYLVGSQRCRAHAIGGALEEWLGLLPAKANATATKPAPSPKSPSAAGPEL
jgi:hypothetical protein